MSKQDTIISLLKEIDKNIDNVGSGGNVSKVKVSTLIVTDECINDDGIWNGEKIIDFSECTTLSNAFAKLTKLKMLDTTSWDLSKVTNFNSFVDDNKELQQIIGIENWNTSSAKTFNNFARGYNKFGELYLDLRKWNVSNVKDIDGFFSWGNGKLNMENWDTRKVENFYRFLYAAHVTWVNMVGFSAKSAISLDYALSNSRFNTIVGDYTIDDVINNNLKVFDDAKVSINITRVSTTNLNRASLRALINGLADLTGQTTQTLTIGETNVAKLTEEDIAIATAKNWTIA